MTQLIVTLALAGMIFSAVYSIKTDRDTPYRTDDVSVENCSGALGCENDTN